MRWIHMSLMVIFSLLVTLGASSADPLPKSLQPAVERALRLEILDDDIVTALEAENTARIIAVYRQGELNSAAGRIQRANAARAQLAAAGYESGRRYEHVPMLAARVDPLALAILLEDPDLLRLSLDPPVQAQLDEAIPLVGLDDLHVASLTGNGVRVAVLDTGVDLAHADLAGAVVDERCFCDDGFVTPAGCCPNGQANQSGPGAAQDDHGHGTRVASIITSAGVHASLGGAPDTALVAVKVLNASGGGYASDIISGLDWVLANHPDVVATNMSLGFGLYPGVCDEADATTLSIASLVDQLADAGVIVVGGAGNNGSGNGMIAPACLGSVLGIGAVWDADVGSQTWFGCTDSTTAADQVTCWSNSSPTTDLFAPGGRMTASMLNATTVTLAGTSYATPMVTACAAVLASAHPGATRERLETALLTSLTHVVDPRNALSFPRLDCLSAHQLLSVPLPSLRPAALGMLTLAFLGGAAATLARLRRRLEAGASR